MRNGVCEFYCLVSSSSSSYDVWSEMLSLTKSTTFAIFRFFFVIAFSVELLWKVIAAFACMHSGTSSGTYDDVCLIGCPHECVCTQFQKMPTKTESVEFYLFDAGCKVTWAMHRTNPAYMRFTCLHGFVERIQMTSNRLHPAAEMHLCSVSDLAKLGVLRSELVRQMASGMIEKFNGSTNHLTVQEVRCHRKEAIWLVLVSLTMHLILKMDLDV